MDKLNELDKNVLALICMGFQNKEIATMIGRTVPDVQYIRVRVCKKLDAVNVFNAVHLYSVALTNGEI